MLSLPFLLPASFVALIALSPFACFAGSSVEFNTILADFSRSCLDESIHIYRRKEKSQVKSRSHILLIAFLSSCYKHSFSLPACMMQYKSSAMTTDCSHSRRFLMFLHNIKNNLFKFYISVNIFPFLRVGILVLH